MESIAKISLALTKAQYAFKALLKTSKTIVKTKTGGQYEFYYADLSSLIELTRNPFLDNELSFTQGTIEVNEKYSVETVLMHPSGESIRYTMPLIGMKSIKDEKGNYIQVYGFDDMQKLGAAITFARRYSLQMLIGVCGEDDTDANEISEQTSEFSKVKKEQVPFADFKASTKQKEYILSLMNQLGKEASDKTLDWLETLTSKDAKQLIEKMKNELEGK